MTTYIGLLYSINVGKNQRVDMQGLRQLAGNAGLQNARTVIATGNLIVESSLRSTKRVEQTLEQAFEAHFGRHVDIIVRSATEWQHLIDANPYADVTENDGSHVLVRVMREPVEKSAQSRLNDLRTGDERITEVNGDPWLYLPHGIADSKLGNGLSRERMKSVGTGRNWNTLLRIRDKL